jgi:D-3-phosphoglycerate dehydrogenase
MGFDVQIMVYDKYNQEDYPKYVSQASLEDIWQEADIISFHVPLREDTYHYMDAAFIEKMQKPFVVINTSRGIVIDAYALWDGLQKKKIRGACIDVWEEEPLSKMSEEMRALLNTIANRPEVVLTPHIAGYSYEAIYKMSKSLLSKIVIHG